MLTDLVGVPAQGLQQDGDRLATLAVDADTDGLALVDVELEPRTAARDDLDREDVDVTRLVDVAVVVDAGRTDQLAYDDTLGAVMTKVPLRVIIGKSPMNTV